MLHDLPAPVAGYLAAERAKDAAALASCFAEDAVVHDEGKDHRGVDAIRSWKAEADAKYDFVVEPLDAARDGATVKLRARVSGDFPGSPVELDFNFTLAGDKIAALDVRG